MSSSDVNWSALPKNILGSIIQRLNHFDTVSFGATCRSWYTSFKPFHRMKKLSNVPWLLLPIFDNSSILHIYSIADRLSYKIHLPKFVHVKYFFGTLGGYIIYKDKNSFTCMFNPITRVCSRLRMTITSADMGRLNLVQNQYFSKAIVNTKRFPSSNLAVEHALTIADTLLVRLRCSLRVSKVYDAVFYKNRIYVVLYNSSMETRAYDSYTDMIVDKHIRIELKEHKELRRRRLVESLNKDELFLVIQDCNHVMEKDRFVTKSFFVYKLDRNGENWVAVDTLGDAALLFGDGGLFMVPSDGSVLRSNSIYFHDRNSPSMHIFDLGKKTLKGFKFPIDLRNFDYETSLWFMPSLI